MPARRPVDRPVWLREKLAPVSLVQIRAWFRPKAWKKVGSVRVEHGGNFCTVKIVRLPDTHAFGGTRSWLACPRCGGFVQTIGYNSEAGFWACSRLECVGGWRGRHIPVAGLPNDDDAVGSTGALDCR